MTDEIGELRLRAIQATTLFGVTESGRLLHGNSPDRSAAPRMWMAGSTAGNIVRIRFDVEEDTAQAIEALVAREPPMSGARATPVHVDEYVELLSADAPVEEMSRDLTYLFPKALEHGHDARVVSSHTPEGAQLLRQIQAEGMPEGLAEMGFSEARDFWPPWCATLNGETIVSIAFTARLSPVGAEVGVVTPSAFRGRGFAAAATAEWSSLRSLEGRNLFYSTDATNVSSQRVAERLRLPFLGPSFSIR
jgi:RimJ/RimL family protein N-acetyltransferase